MDVEGRITSGGAAVADLLGALGHPRLAGSLARVERPIEWLYALVAEHRDRLGRLVPDGDAPERFP